MVLIWSAPTAVMVALGQRHNIRGKHWAKDVDELQIWTELGFVWSLLMLVMEMKGCLMGICNVTGMLTMMVTFDNDDAGHNHT